MYYLIQNSLQEVEKEKLKATQAQYVAVLTSEEWKSQKEACDTLHLDGGSLSHALSGWRINQRGKVPVHTYHGYIWKFKKNYNGKT